MRLEEWRGARVLSNEPAASDMVSLLLEPEEPVPHRAGQHYELRILGDELGRKYSIVTPPGQEERLEFGIQLLPNGLVSPRLAALRPGDRIDIRGPLGEAFLWSPADGSSLILIGGGAGITPLLSMYVHFTDSCPEGRCLFLLSATESERIYRYDRWKSSLRTRFTAREPRLATADLEKLIGDQLLDPESAARICGPTSMIDAMVDSLVELGLPELRIRSEAFA